MSVSHISLSLFSLYSKDLVTLLAIFAGLLYFLPMVIRIHLAGNLVVLLGLDSEVSEDDGNWRTEKRNW